MKMTLQRVLCENISSSVFDGDPDVQTRTNILYVPRTEAHDERFGLFEESGRILLSSALFHGHPSSLKSQPLLNTSGDAKGHPEIDRAIYGGAIGLHYGHFITECLNTLWWFQRHGRSTDHLLFHSSSTVDEIYKTPYAAGFFNLIGLRREQVIIPSHTTKVRTLIVPNPAFCEDGFAYRAFGRFCNWIGEQAESFSPSRHHRPVFLSRNRLQAGTVKVENEEDLLTTLENGGVDIVYPEEISIYDQIALFRRSPLVAGLHGSAFHTSVFARGVKGIAMTLEPHIRRSFPLLDALSGAEIEYFYPTERTLETPLPNFHQTIRIVNARGVGRELLRRMETRIEQSFSTAFPKESSISAGVTSPVHQTAFHVRSKAGEILAVEQSSGWIYSKTELGDKFDALIVFRFGRLAVLMANSGVAPVIRIGDDELSAPALAYDIVDYEGFSALYNTKTERYLTSIPGHLNQTVACRAAGIQDWEQFTLEPVADFMPRDRLALILSWLQRKSDTSEAQSALPEGLSFLHTVLERLPQ